MTLTNNERAQIVQEILTQIKASSQGVNELPEVANLDGVKSLPAMKGTQVVVAPVSLLSQTAERALFNTLWTDLWGAYGAFDAGHEKPYAGNGIRMSYTDARRVLLASIVRTHNVSGDMLVGAFSYGTGCGFAEIGDITIPTVAPITLAQSESGFSLRNFMRGNTEMKRVRFINNKLNGITNKITCLQSAFQGCSSLQQILGWPVVDANASVFKSFYGCTGLKKIELCFNCNVDLAGCDALPATALLEILEHAANGITIAVNASTYMHCDDSDTANEIYRVAADKEITILTSDEDAEDIGALKFPSEEELLTASADEVRLAIRSTLNPAN